MFRKMRIPLDRTDGSFLEYRRLVLPAFYSTGLTHVQAMHQIAPMDVLFADWRGPAIFILERDIGELLLNTSMGDTELDDLRLPFPTMYIELPDNDFKVAFGEEDIGTLRGVYILEDPEKEGGKPVTFIFVSHFVSDTPMDDCIVSYPVYFKEGPLRPQIEERIRRMESEGDESEAVRETNRQVFEGTFGWIMSILFYLTTPEARIDWGKDRKGVPIRKMLPKKKRKHAPSDRVFPVGRGIVIRSRPPRGEGAGEKTGTGTGIRRQAHWVSGHFRRVAYGAERKMRRIKWIAPFVRGEGSEHLRPGVYRVKK